MYRQILNRGLFLLLMLVGGISVQAQELVLEGFYHDMGDITARANPHVDRNGDKCALIKISTGIPNVNWVAHRLNTMPVPFTSGCLVAQSLSSSSTRSSRS